ncbi:MAG: Fic family protein [Gammaproteobacteria bacterium]|nr:Fic family protein [Gammaproteobacteria bacterium]
MTYEPPYVITPEILARVEEIGEAIGRAEEMAAWQDLRLRRINRIRSIQGSLAIEGNALTEGEITTLLEGRPVAAPPRDIQEARNAIRAYDELPGWNPATEAHLLRAHEAMMRALLDAPGVYRQGQVAVVGDGEVRHVGPPAPRVPRLMRDLLGWLSGTDAHPLIASSVFHYEFEYIHPFEDGNGRIGRLWQTLILSRWNPLFLHIPVESLVHARQMDYYAAIQRSTDEGASTPFIVFMLDVVLAALRTPQETPQETPQVLRLLAVVNGEMSASEILQALGLRDRKSLRQRYLLPALQHGHLEMTRPDTPRARNQRYRLTDRGRAARGTGRTT